MSRQCCADSAGGAVGCRLALMPQSRCDLSAGWPPVCAAQLRRHRSSDPEGTTGVVASSNHLLVSMLAAAAAVVQRGAPWWPAAAAAGSLRSGGDAGGATQSLVWKAAVATAPPAVT